MHHGWVISFLKELIQLLSLTDSSSLVFGRFRCNSKNGTGVLTRLLGQNVPYTFPTLDETSIDQLQDLLQNGVITSVDLVHV